MVDLESTILHLLEKSPKGLTWKQLEKYLNVRGFEAGHGTISGCLSGLHTVGQVFYLKKTSDDGCHPYVHSLFKSTFDANQRVDNPRISKWKTLSDSVYELLKSDNPNKVEIAINMYEGVERNAN